MRPQLSVTALAIDYDQYRLNPSNGWDVRALCAAVMALNSIKKAALRRP